METASARSLPGPLELFAALAEERGLFCALAGAPLATSAPGEIPCGREQTVLAADPLATLTCQLGKTPRLVHRDGYEEPAPAGSILEALSWALARLGENGIAGEKGAAGCAVALSYDAAPAFLPGALRLSPKSTPREGAPLLVASFYEAVLLSNPGSSELRPAVTGFADPRWKEPGRQAKDRGQELLSKALQKCAPSQAGMLSDAALQSSLARKDYLGAIGRAKEYIAAGDVYQINLTQQLRLTPTQEFSPPALWQRLAASHPTGWSAYFDMGAAGVLLSNSPECFLRRRGEQVETFPIKGTRRTQGEEKNRAISELKGDAKELAEHRMIVDLERNDLGRLAKIGSVSVPAREYVESYGTVHHLVSCVRAQVEPQLSTTKLLEALFPGGSITGAPKKRAVEIIAELEPLPRGFYTGTLGTLSKDGTADFSILIRTAHWKQEGKRGALTYSCGGGIVADSVPKNEVAESWLKASAFLKACGIEKESA